ncbi:hypothetical protein ABT001_04650 [Streptomyces sp. NPDC002793]|uniref:SCO2400 family protein n=1 Tax=Streptomyces sp. NPDC002793 TaxID=3154432 RepID=UPI00332FF75A
MDYCHPCQRHLNGALACAGCGTPVDALVPYAVVDGSARAARPAAETLDASGTAGHRRRARGATERRGRRAHRRRGRALLLTVAGVVLALGALSLAELATEPGGDGGASDYVSEATSTAEVTVPSASSSTGPDAPGPVDGPAGPTGPTVVPVDDSRSATPTDGSAATTEAPGEAAPPASTPAESSPPDSAPTAPEETGAPAEPSGSGEPSAPPTSPEPPGDPAPAPTPSPSPTETCEWWQIFCD